MVKFVRIRIWSKFYLVDYLEILFEVLLEILFEVYLGIEVGIQFGSWWHTSRGLKRSPSCNIRVLFHLKYSIISFIHYIGTSPYVKFFIILYS